MLRFKHYFYGLLLAGLVFPNSLYGFADNRPNIIIIMVDDMGFSDIGCYGSEIPTPNLDSLASNGLRFSQFYNTGRCCPTRASLLTGLYSHQAGIGWMEKDQGLPGYQGHLNSQCVTIGEVLQQAGYFTAMAGKWHVGFNFGVTPWDRGFDRSLNMPAGGLHFSNQTGFKGDTKLFLNGKQVDRDDPQFNPPWYGTDLWTEQGIRFIDEAKEADKPFFLYLAHVAPHFPCMAPEETISKYRGKYSAGWDVLREERQARQKSTGLIKEQWKMEPRPKEIPAWESLSDKEKTRYDDMMAIYAAMIEEVDKNIGKLVSALRDRNELENTLILFLSDNGGNAETGIKGIYKGESPGDENSNVFIGRCWAHLNNTPFRKYKHYNHEGGIATPLVAHWPAAVKPNNSKDGWISTPTHIIDLMATCVDVGEAEYPSVINGNEIKPYEGQSLKPLLSGQGEFASRNLYWEHEGNAAVRVGSYKLVREGRRGDWELFDLDSDRTEQFDISDKNPKIVDDLSDKWDLWAKRVGASPAPQKNSKKKNDKNKKLGKSSFDKKSRQPNIVTVFIDDMGWSDLSCFGGTYDKTENIDQLAKEGIRFTNFYVNSPICSPSRVALTTGQYPQRWKITSYLSNRKHNQQRGMAQWLDPSAPVLARELNKAGYATGHFGKWHMGGQRDVDNAPSIAEYGFDQSLTNFEGMGAKLLPMALMPDWDQPQKIWEGAIRLGGPPVWMLRSHVTEGFVASAVSFIDEAQREDKPFYLNLWPDDVHAPLYPPVEYWEDEPRARYYKVLKAMDEQLGPLFNRIRNDENLKDNTIIFFCSDNGPQHDLGMSEPLRGAKTWLYEAGVRSPLIVWGPGFVPKEREGAINEQSIFSAIDLNRSIYELTSTYVPESAELDGENVASTLLGNETTGRVSPIYWRRPPDRPGFGHGFDEDNPDLAVRDGKWKFYVNYDLSGQQLYDLEADASEQNNLVTSYPEVGSRLLQAIVNWNKDLPKDAGSE